MVPRDSLSLQELNITYLSSMYYLFRNAPEGSFYMPEAHAHHGRCSVPPATCTGAIRDGIGGPRSHNRIMEPYGSKLSKPQSCSYKIYIAVFILCTCFPEVRAITEPVLCSFLPIIHENSQEFAQSRLIYAEYLNTSAPS
jgi:hypothetical protein